MLQLFRNFWPILLNHLVRPSLCRLRWGRPAGGPCGSPCAPGDTTNVADWLQLVPDILRHKFFSASLEPLIYVGSRWVCTHSLHVFRRDRVLAQKPPWGNVGVFHWSVRLQSDWFCKNLSANIRASALVYTRMIIYMLQFPDKSVFESCGFPSSTVHACLIDTSQVYEPKSSMAVSFGRVDAFTLFGFLFGSIRILCRDLYLQRRYDGARLLDLNLEWNLFHELARVLPVYRLELFSSPARYASW